MPSFGSRLRDTRRGKEITQEDLAGMMGISQAAISQFEKNQRTPTPATIDKFAECLGVDRVLLVGKDDAELEAQFLSRNFKGLSPESRKEIINIVKKYKEAEAR